MMEIYRIGPIPGAVVLAACAVFVLVVSSL